MRRIFIINDDISSKINGIGTYVNELYSKLMTLNADVYIISFNSNVQEFVFHMENGIRKICFPLSSISYFSLPEHAVGVLRLYIEDTSDNLFVVNHFPSNELAKELKKRFSLSEIAFVIHDMIWTSQFKGDPVAYCKFLNTADKNSNIYRDFKNERSLYNLVDKVIVLSNDTKLLLLTAYEINSEKIIYLPNSLKDFYVAIEDKKKKEIKKRKFITNERIILYTGRVTKSKGSFCLIKCFHRVLESYPDCRIVFVGTVHDHKETFNLSKDISTKISFTGHVSKEEVQEWYLISDIGVLPSYFEQCSYSGIEMMMHKLPIVSSDGFGIKDMFREGENALIAKIEEYENSEKFENNLSTRILNLLQSLDLCDKLRDTSRQTYMQKYNSDASNSNYTLLLEKRRRDNYEK